MSSAKGAGSEMLELLDSMPEINAKSNEGQIPRNVQGRIRFENIDFRYPTRPRVRVLKNLSLTVEPGTTRSLATFTYVYFKLHNFI